MRFLLDEMYPPDAAAQLTERGHDAVHVNQLGLAAADDADVVAVGRSEGRAMVTENVAAFAGERDLVLVFVRKRKLPRGGAQAPALAAVLDRWADADPDPYVGPHWLA